MQLVLRPILDDKFCLLSAKTLKKRWQNVRKAYKFNYLSTNGRPNYYRTEELNFLDPTFTPVRNLNNVNQEMQNAIDGMVQDLEVDIANDQELHILNDRNDAEVLIHNDVGINQDHQVEGDGIDENFPGLLDVNGILEAAEHLPGIFEYNGLYVLPWDDILWYILLTHIKFNFL